MKRIVLVALILALIGGGYYFYQNQDEQLISKQVDQFLENVEHKKISLRKPSDVETAVNEVIADEVIFCGAPPVPTGPHSKEKVIEQLEMLHGFTTLCEINESDRTIRIEGNEAQVRIKAEVHVAIGKNIQRREDWTMVFTLKKSDVWRINGIKGIPPGNATSAEEVDELF